jgi:D-sedoheptulose 7-phosphate isomerase
MKQKIKDIIVGSIETKTHLLYDAKTISGIEESARSIVATLKKGGKVLICGNGGSAADSQHFAAELVGRFQKERRALAAMALSTDTSVLTSLSNDYAFDRVFERQIEALASSKDLLFAISTSGKAKNVIAAVKRAKKIGLKTIGLTGRDGGDLAKITDIPLVVPSALTARIQELHILIIHIICALVEDTL